MNRKAFFAALSAFICLMSSAYAQIEAGQSIEIKIMGVPAVAKPEVEGTYPVSEKGMVNMPFIGEIRAAGLESDQLAKNIQSAYRDEGIFNNPAIQVIWNQNGKGVLEQQVHIGGQVRATGPKPYRKGLTVFQAVQAAGGANEFGAMNRVILWREGKQRKIDLTTPEGKGVITEPNDTIEVPQKNPFGR